MRSRRSASSPTCEGKIFADASAELRPASAIQNLIVNIDPGTPARGPLPDRRADPTGRTSAFVSIDELTGVLDADTRAYAQILVGEAERGLHGRGGDLSAALAQLADLTDEARPISRSLATRRRLLTRLRRPARHRRDDARRPLASARQRGRRRQRHACGHGGARPRAGPGDHAAGPGAARGRPLARPRPPTWRRSSCRRSTGWFRSPATSARRPRAAGPAPEDRPARGPVRRADQAERRALAAPAPGHAGPARQGRAADPDRGGPRAPGAGHGRVPQRRRPACRHAQRRDLGQRQRRRVRAGRRAGAGGPEAGQPRPAGVGGAQPQRPPVRAMDRKLSIALEETCKTNEVACILRFLVPGLPREPLTVGAGGADGPPVPRIGLVLQPRLHAPSRCSPSSSSTRRSRARTR